MNYRDRQRGGGVPPLKTTGTGPDRLPIVKVWQKESFDHIVRSRASLDRFRRYIVAHRSGAEDLLVSDDQRRDAAATLADEATTPIATNPAFRDLLETKRRDREITIDHLASDEVLVA